MRKIRKGDDVVVTTGKEPRLSAARLLHFERSMFWSKARTA